MRKRAKRVLFVVLAAIGLVTGGALVFIRTSVFEEWLLRRLETMAEDAGHRVTAERLHFDLWQLRATLENVTYEDGRTVSARAGRLFVDVPREIFRQDILRFTDLQLDGLTIDFAAATQPTANETIEIPQIVFDRLAIRNASLTYTDGATSIRIPSFDLETENGRGALRFRQPVTVSPDIRFTMPVVDLQMSGQALEFGPGMWQVDHPEVSLSGSSRGRFQWSPEIAVNSDHATDPFDYQQWRDLESSASVNYTGGVLKVTGIRLIAGNGIAEGSAEINDGVKTVKLLWEKVNLVPAGFPATTGGNLQLQWRASDLKDLSGDGSLQIDSRQYGRVQSGVSIRNARSTLDIRGNGFDTTLRATVETGLDRTLTGSFQAVHTRYGGVRAEGSFSGRLDDPQMNARLTAPGITAGGIGPIRASANAALRSRIVTIDDIQAEYRNSVVPNGSLRLDLDKRTVTGEVPEIRVQLADIAPNVEGMAKLAAVVGGTIDRPAARIAGSSDSLNVQGTRIDSIKLLGEADLSRFLLTELTAQQRDGRLSAAGTYDFNSETIDGRANLSAVRIDQIQDASAIASVTARFGGTIRSPKAEFTGRLDDVNYQNQSHGNLDLEGSIQNDIASLRLKSGKYAADATAEIAMKAPYAYTASVVGRNSEVAYQQYHFTAGGRAEASGELQPVSVASARFDDFSLRGEGLDLRASGSLSEGIRLNGTADLSKLPIENVQARGNALVQAIVSGSVNDPRIQGSLETSDATLQAGPMTEPANVRAALDFSGNEFTIRMLQAVYAGATANISGGGTLSGSGRFQFRADGIRPERLISDRPIAGIVNVQGEVDVAKPAIEAISGSMKVNQLELVLGNIPVHQVQPIELRFQNQVVTAQNALIEGLNTRASISGSADLKARSLDFKIDGNADLRTLEVFIPGSGASGQITASVAVAGAMENPQIEGALRLSDMQLQLADPPVFVTDTNAEIRLRDGRAQIASAAGIVNLGKFTAIGGADISAAGIGDAAIELVLAGAQTEYPEGFESEISSRLALKGSGNNWELTGNVDILNGAYRRDIDLTEEVISRVTSRPLETAVSRETQPAAIEHIRLNLEVSTPGVVSVANNLANFDMEGSFRVRGTVGNPVITGRASVEEGGEIYFGPQVGNANAAELERRDRYVISEGSIDFNNPIITEPSFNFVATRELQGQNERYVITLRASGTPDKFKSELTSDPELDQPDIVAMLLTGRRLDELEGNELVVAQEQAAAYLSGRFGSLFQSAGSAFGLNTVRIDPVLLAQDADLSARLTIGKDITSNLGLVYSQNLSGPRAQTWIASYQAIKDLLIRGINRSDDNNLTVELRHDLKWGGGPELPKAPKRKDERTLGQITFEGTTIPMKDLLKQVEKTGKPFNTYRLNEDIRKLREYFADRDLLAARIRPVRNPKGGAMDVRFVIDEGPSITFEFQGAKTPKTIQEDIRQIWIRGFNEASSLRQSQERLLRYFRDEGYLRATVSARDESPTNTQRRFVFGIAPGVRFNDPRWVFNGIEPIDLNVTPGVVLEDPKAIQDRIQNALLSEGYLNATCTEPRLITEGENARFEISVELGPRFSIGRLTANEPEAIRLIPPGDASDTAGKGLFSSSWLDRTRQTIIGDYLARGFNDVQVNAETRVPDVGTTVDVAFMIDKGERQVVNSIEIEGNRTTSIAFIRGLFTFQEGDPVDYSRINETRKKLYDTRLFRRVDLRVADDNGGHVARTVLNEKPPWNFRYGFAVTNKLQTSDREFGFTADFSYSNLFGKAITTGTSVKYTPDMREARAFSSLPVFLGKSVTTTGAVFRTRDLSIENWIDDVLGFTIQQQWKLRKNYLLSYDYTYKHSHGFEIVPNPDFPIPLDTTIPVARFNATLSRDTRDDLLNATRGSFLSNSFEIAPPGVGSSIQFFRNFTQVFRFQQIRERLGWASAYRVGVAHDFREPELIFSERFRAGGGNTLRGFQQDKLGLPGAALIIVNQELRFPLFWRFSGVGFLDAGNLYSSIRSINPLKLRYSPGAGLRINTPFVLVRFDMGINVAPRPGEARTRFSFGVGQAF